MNELKLADLGEGMHEAEIVEWLIQEGDTVRLDQPVVRVETDKAIVEIPSPVAGRVSELRFQAGQTVKVGEVLALYDLPQERGSGPGKESGAASSLNKGAPAPGAPTPIERARAALAEDPAPANGTGPKRRVLAAPAVRKLAF